MLPGSTRRGRHYRALAESLSDEHTVHLVDRRGRGASPPQGPDYGIDQEVSDAIEVITETGSRQLFGHSFGGLIALHVALRHDLDRLIAYEPAISVNGSIPTGWMPRYAELLAAGRDARAMVHFLHGLDLMPSGPVMVAVAWVMQRLTADGRDLRGGPDHSHSRIPRSDDGRLGRQPVLVDHRADPFARRGPLARVPARGFALAGRHHSRGEVDHDARIRP